MDKPFPDMGLSGGGEGDVRGCSFGLASADLEPAPFDESTAITPGQSIREAGSECPKGPTDCNPVQANNSTRPTF